MLITVLKCISDQPNKKLHNRTDIYSLEHAKTLLWVLWPFFAVLLLTLNNSSGHSTFLVKFVALLTQRKIASCEPLWAQIQQAI